MENRESRNLLEVALFVEGQNLGNFVILHDDAMDDVADTRMRSIGLIIEWNCAPRLVDYFRDQDILVPEGSLIFRALRMSSVTLSGLVLV